MYSVFLTILVLIRIQIAHAATPEADETAWRQRIALLYEKVGDGQWTFRCHGYIFSDHGILTDRHCFFTQDGNQRELWAAIKGQTEMHLLENVSFPENSSIDLAKANIEESVPFSEVLILDAFAQENNTCMILTVANVYAYTDSLIQHRAYMYPRWRDREEFNPMGRYLDLLTTVAYWPYRTIATLVTQSQMYIYATDGKVSHGSSGAPVVCLINGQERLLGLVTIAYMLGNYDAGIGTYTRLSDFKSWLLREI